MVMNTNTRQSSRLTAPQRFIVGIVWAVVAWDIISTVLTN